MKKGVVRPKKKLKSSKEDALRVPSKPVPPVMRIKDTDTWEQREAIYTQYAEEKRAYHENVIAFVKQKGVHGMPMTKIRIFFESESILSKGGRRILEHRWDQYVKGEMVPRVASYRYKRPFPDYTLFERQSSRLFKTSDVRCVPMDVLTMHMLPHLDNVSLIHLMLTCKQFQAYAHRELFLRAQREFGPRGTPMAIHARYVCNSTQFRYILLSFNCLDNYLTANKYDRDQAKVNSEDNLLLSQFKNEDFGFVRNVVIEVLGNVFDIILSTHDKMAKCVFFSSTFIRIFDGVYGNCSSRLLSLLSQTVNSGSRDAAHLTKLLQKYKPDTVTQEVMELFTKHQVYNYISSYASLYFDNLGKLIRAMTRESEHRGMHWVRNLVFTHECYKILLLATQCTITFVFHQAGHMAACSTEIDVENLFKGYLCEDGYYTKR